MSLLLLIRHGVTDQTGTRLSGRTPGIHLSDAGREQVRRLADRLRGIRLDALYTSPLERCVETAGAVAEGRRLRPRVVRALSEVDYGDWTGRSFAALRRTKMWARVRAAPSAVRFPSGETLLEVQRRASESLDLLARRHPRGTIGLVSHGDVIRLAVAHYAGVHIDLFQRIGIGPASVSAVAIDDDGPRVLRLNDTGDLRDLVGG